MRNPKTSKTKTGAEIVGSIDDLLKQIFVHLPLLPLTRFKLVSKHWKSIISNPRLQLMRSQVPNNNRAVGLFVLYHRWHNLPKETRFISLSSDPQKTPKKIPDTLEISHSCNGLFVLQNTSKKHGEFYVYNPTTNEKSMVKDKKGGWSPDCVLGMYMAFDPSKSPHYYKLVCVWKLSRTNRHRRQVQFDVYSSETGSWETRSRSMTANVADNSFDKGVFWNGAMHWFNSTGDSICLSVDDHDVLPRVLPNHPTHHKERSGYFLGYYIGESCGHLHCAGLARDQDDLPCWVYVYEMRRDYSEWFIKYKVEENTQYMRNSYKVRYLQSVVRGDKDDDSFLVLGNGEGEMIRYNLANNTFQTIQHKELKNDTNSMIPRTLQYIESPCSV